MQESWTGSANINLAQIFVDRAVPFVHGPTRVALTITNELTSSSEPGTSGIIAKKDLAVTVATVNVREPCGLWPGVGAGGCLAPAGLAGSRKAGRNAA